MNETPNGPRKVVRDLEQTDDFDFYDKSRRKVIDLSQYAKSEAPKEPEGGLGTPVRSIQGLEDAPVGDLVMPLPYQVTPSGSVVRLSCDSEGRDVEDYVCGHPVLIGCTLTDSQTAQQQTQVVFKRNGRWRKHVLDGALFGSPRDLMKALKGVGAPVVASEAKALTDFLGRLEIDNSGRLPERTSAKHGGWHHVDGKTVFLFGHDALPASGDTTDCLLFDGADQRDRVAKSLRAKGNIGEQLATLKTAFEASLPAATAILGALAAPLLRPLGVPCFVIHLVGPSSRGKSTVLQLAAGIYGNPDMRLPDSFIAQWNATAVGLEFRAEACCDLPLCLDEAGVMPPDKREGVVYHLVSGQGRTRGAKTGGQRYTPTWRTVILSTGETELVSANTRAGAQVRVLQPRVDGLGELTAQDVDELKRSSYEQYGWVGRQWVLSLLREDNWDLERARLADFRRDFQARIQGSSLDSRQAEMFALLAYVETRAARELGIGDPEGGTMRRWLQASQDERVRVAPEWERALDAINERVQARSRAYPELVIGTKGGKVAKATDTGPSVDIEGYLDEGNGELLLLPHAAARLLGERSLDAEVVAREWKRQGVLGSSEPGRCTVKRCVGGTRGRFYALRLSALRGDEGGPDF